MINPLCKNCGNPTSFPASADPERKGRGWCYPCFRKYKRGQKIKNVIKDKKLSEPGFSSGNLVKSEKIAEFFCRNCALRSTARPSEDSERLKERLCKKCFGWWLEDPDDEEMQFRLMDHRRRQSQGRV